MDPEPQTTAAIKFCRSKKHEFEGDNIMLLGEKRRCRACYYEAQKNSRRSRRLKQNVEQSRDVLIKLSRPNIDSRLTKLLQQDIPHLELRVKLAHVATAEIQKALDEQTEKLVDAQKLLKQAENEKATLEDIKAQRAEQDLEPQTRRINEVKRQYLDGVLTHPEARVALTDLGVPFDAALDVLEALEKANTDSGAPPTEITPVSIPEQDVILRKLKSGEINATEATEALVALFITSDEAKALIKEARITT